MINNFAQRAISQRAKAFNSEADASQAFHKKLAKRPLLLCIWCIVITQSHTLNLTTVRAV